MDEKTSIAVKCGWKTSYHIHQQLLGEAENIQFAVFNVDGRQL